MAAVVAAAAAGAGGAWRGGDGVPRGVAAYGTSAVEAMKALGLRECGAEVGGAREEEVVGLETYALGS